MTIIDRAWARSIVLAIVAAVSVTVWNISVAAQDPNDPASAEDEGPDEGENGASDEEGEGKDKSAADGEEASTSQWMLSGVVNRAFLMWNDGRRGALLVDNPQDSTGFALEGEFELGRGWVAGMTFTLDTYYASADSVDQLDANGDGAVAELNDAYVEIGHETWGKIVLGIQDSASDDIDNINLSGSDVIADASANNWNNNFFLRGAGVGIGLATGRMPLPSMGGGGEDGGGEDEGEGDDDEGNGNGNGNEVGGNAGLAELRWGDFLDGPLAGEGGGRFITYVTPEIMGFEGAATVGRPQELFLLRGSKYVYNQRGNGLFRDVGLRYSADWGNLIRVRAGLGFWKDDTEEKNADERTDDQGWAGSLALMHIPTGLNIAVNYGITSHTNRCVEPGALSGGCRGDDRFVYTKGGIVRDLFNWGPTWGPTALYGEFYKGWKAQNETDEDLLRFAELNFGEAEELKGSVATMWGLGVSQTFKSIGSFPVLGEVYVGYRHYELDLRLIGGQGPVPSRGIKDFDVVMAGITVRWGGQQEDALGRPLERSQRPTPSRNR